MSVQVYGCNHVAIEVDDIDKAVAFYEDVFNLERLDRGEGDAFFKLGEHQFLAIFEVEKIQPANMRHFGIMVRDEEQLEEVGKKLTGKYKLKLEPPFRCDFRDPWGNRIQVVDLHDESLIWLFPYREVQKAGVKFDQGRQNYPDFPDSSKRSSASPGRYGNAPDAADRGCRYSAVDALVHYSGLQRRAGTAINNRFHSCRRTRSIRRRTDWPGRTIRNRRSRRCFNGRNCESRAACRRKGCFN